MVREPPPNSHLHLQKVLMHYRDQVFDLQRFTFESWRATWTRSFLKLKPGASVDDLNRDLRALVERRVPPTAMFSSRYCGASKGQAARPVRGLR